MKRKLLKAIVAMTLCLCILMQSSGLLTAKAGVFYPVERNSYYGLLVPTQLTKIGDTFYLVDSYHNQVLFSTQYGVLSSSWKVMSKNFLQPHSIAGDGVVYLVTDTENGRVVSYTKEQEGFTEQQIFNGIGVRPHYIVYDEPTGLFYAWSSMTGEMYLFRRKPDTAEVYLENIMRVPELYGKYVRSFTIEGGTIYFPCVHSSSIVAVDKSTFKVKNIYPVPENIAGMVQLTRIQNYYYLTVSTDINFDPKGANIVRARTLADFSTGNYESVNKKFGGDGAPYYISSADGSYFTVVIRTTGRACGYKFDVVNDELCNMEELTY